MNKQSSNNKVAVLLVTDKSSSGIIQLFRNIQNSLNGNEEAFLAYHQKGEVVPDTINQLDHFIFKNDILTNLGYIPIGETLVPGNNHFPLLMFYNQNQEYEKYWVIEDDVRFTGDWSDFLSTSNLINADFISCCIRRWHDEPNWYWWDFLKHPNHSINNQDKMASFNPIYCMSNKALSYIDSCLKEEWSGHHEVLLPTLLIRGGFSLADFGGNGNFVPEGFKNKFYHIIHTEANGVFSDGTMRHYPAMGYVGHLKNKLYHPVKCFDEKAERYDKTSSDREGWLTQMDRIARPVIENLANDRLRMQMVVELSKRIDHSISRKGVAYLEAFARTFSGIAPWLNSNSGDEKEKTLRQQYREWVLKAIANAVNPNANDYMIWQGGQALVDASYFALGLIRSPWIMENLEAEVRNNVIRALVITRNTLPVYTNWILFSAMIETFFCRYGYQYDILRIEFGLREFMEHWYVGDGMFSDGMSFHLDYYNSYVIQPYILTILDVVNFKNGMYNHYNSKFDIIAKRYAEIQERMINTDGSFPAIGRSITYRCGAFHHLADMALKKRLPDSLIPSQVREALFAVIQKTLHYPNTFDQKGWLKIGLHGSQSDLADFYITTGSLYMCLNAFLPLGLPNSDVFWHSPAEPWSSVKIWSGTNILKDSSLDI